jgi:hypothetical protein
VTFSNQSATFTVQRFCHGDMAHAVVGYRSMPMLFSSRKPYGVARPDLFNRSAFPLHPSEARGDEDCLAKWMTMLALRALGSKGTVPAELRPGSVTFKCMSTRPLRMKELSGPLLDGCVPARFMSMMSPVLQLDLL